MSDYGKHAAFLIMSFLMINFSIRAEAHLQPMVVGLNVVPPAGWRFLAPKGAAIQSLVPPGFQGHIESTQKSDANDSTYEINIYAFRRDSKPALSLQLEEGFRAVFPNYEVSKQQPAKNGAVSDADVADRLIEAPYGRSVITTLLHAKAGPKTIVIVEAVVRGPVEGNSSLGSIKKLIPELTYSFDK